MLDEKTKIEIELVIFSGRPNPVWVLKDEETEVLRKKLDVSLPETLPGRAPQLGYRGFIIRNLVDIPGIPAYMLVFDGVFSVEEEAGFRHFEDNAGIENWLLESDFIRDSNYHELIVECLEHLHSKI